ncbi:gp6 domain containing protein [uncultured Caudovirales phage]|jgi:hypothetical protein|uniref:Gp6 domain containing protein n=1 Tax=uncultured Caudovirales phage TaxID=2100421 RepID=A0A6J5M8Z3_9CAUD|nr:gp6 domain containing protein [uncultured Caudovirales phage]
MAITNGYATLSEVKASLRITDAIDDALLETAIESASRMIDGFTARTFSNAGTAVRHYAATDALNLIIDDAISISEVASTDEIGDTYTVWKPTDFQLEPLNSRSDGLYMPYTGIRAVNDYTWPVVDQQALCRITGVWGWASVPTAIRQATVIQSSRLFKRLDSPLGIAGFGDMGAIRVNRYLDSDVEQLAMPYRIMRNFG